ERLPRRSLRRLRLPVRRQDPECVGLQLPPPPHRPPQGARPGGRHPAPLPGRLLRPRARHPDRPPGGRRRAPLRRHAPPPARAGPRDLVPGGRRHGQDDARDADLLRGAAPRAHRRDLLAAAPARDAARVVQRRLGGLAERAARPADRSGAPAHRRRRGGEDEPVGARAALLDRQRPLRGRPGDHAHHEPRPRRARGADRRADGLPAHRGLRRSAAPLRRGPAQGRGDRLPARARRRGRRAALRRALAGAALAASARLL
ncbi:MAG: hypothetical protein AVDCRST_MAG30-1791, partial [uncultured Solirubrobacteraceae bacterium]